MVYRLQSHGRVCKNRNMKKGKFLCSSFQRGRHPLLAMFRIFHKSLGPNQTIVAYLEPWNPFSFIEHSTIFLFELPQIADSRFMKSSFLLKTSSVMDYISRLRYKI
jgi:hypothetical protein